MHGHRAQAIHPNGSLCRYLLFAAEPYETIAFKVPSLEVDKTEGKLFQHCEHPGGTQACYRRRWPLLPHLQCCACVRRGP